ncbi:rhomboid family intramembrane serine protease [Luteolibacter sp. GHJ8]|uniref:Rhomboid family intramembrane serine protease n=1 Tax=Luteolibacter rhizosphaerae TaxID=2989719 RepID=A0ABT3FWL8_9BACT|nr:rhomboid family intramembrane serine protease [Luteolibacter rhizosphaerae]MCW1911974.1 rhomboid family intramembrane serine protease [Luteolibacter rhizosphaerae]
MGSSDRDYFRDEEARYARQGPGMPPVTKFLLWAIIVIFVVDWLILQEAISRILAFQVATAFGQGKIWELVTFQFLHGSPGHLVFNCFALYTFGPWLERWWGSRRFTAYYLICGAGGALLYTLLGGLGIVMPGGSLVGASAGIYGCLVGAAVIDPKVQLQLFLIPFTLTVRKLALILLGISVLVIIGGLLSGDAMFDNAGGEAGHLGGAILGFLLVKYPFLLRKGERAKGSKILHPPEFKRKPKTRSKLAPRTKLEIATASEVDRILDKINREGIQSLTAKEKEILNEAGKSKKDR